MNPLRWHVVLGLAVLLVPAPEVQAQKNPRIGYVYPAGGRQGDTFEVTVGGQFLDGVDRVLVSGKGAKVTVVEHHKPLTQKEINTIRQKVQEARRRMLAQQKARQQGNARGKFKPLVQIVQELGVSPAEFEAFEEIRKKLADPKRQLNPQIAETVTLRVTLAEDAQPGPRDLRLVTASGLTNPLRFHVGQLPEYYETEPNDKTADAGIQGSLPVVINGQVMPGDVDRFSFRAQRGERLVVAAAARALVPYLADAVPGWFQATLTLYDANGKELAYDDDYRFHPDPLLFCEIPEDGRYVLEIKDAIYRGREDFVYRITLGEVPFVTSIFPLGGRQGDPATVKVTGWNLPVDKLTLDVEEKESGIRPVSVRSGRWISNRVPFAVDTLPECLEEEPNDERESAQSLELPLIVNGRIDHPGDWDVFRIEGHAGSQLVAEVQARRLDSPLDSVLELTGADGRRLMVNDDHEDKAAGLITHHADSRLEFTIPPGGTCYLRLGDMQQQGGTAYGYRLRVAPRRGDFQLRVVPSGITARAGATVPITVYALRKDGFSDDITLRLKDAPPGFALSGAWVPAGKDRLRATLTVPAVPSQQPVILNLEGTAVIEGREVRRPAVPAEDMTQAFIYHHLVPVEDWVVAVIGQRRFGAAVKRLGKTPVRIPAGGSAQVQFSMPKWLIGSQIQLALNEPPEGIALGKVSPGAEGVTISLRIDGAKVEPGLKGNLLIDAFTERTVGGRGTGRPATKRRIPLGTLPAIPFEVAAP